MNAPATPQRVCRVTAPVRVTAIVRGISEMYVTALQRCTPLEAWEELRRHQRQVGTSGPFGVTIKVGRGTPSEHADFNITKPSPRVFALARRRGYWLASWEFNA